MAVSRSGPLSLGGGHPFGRNKHLRKSFKWTSDLLMMMAKYLSDHYAEYLAAIKRGKKIQFLRIMKTELDGLKFCHDTQLKNGFFHFIKKYEIAKANMNSLVGEHPDAAQHKEGIIRQCPYFYILDATFDTNPIPYVGCSESGDTGNEIIIKSYEGSSSGDSTPNENNTQQDIEIDIVEEDNEYSECPVSPPNYLDCDLVSRSPSVASYVKDACKHNGIAKGKTKSAVDMLIALIDSKVHDQIEVEKQKLKLEERRFEAEHSIEKKKLDIEFLKVKTQSECETQRFAMEKAKNELEFEKLKMQQESEIKKLQLQIELEKLKRLSRNTAEDN